MSEIHIVQKNETIQGIADQYGFSDWKVIYEHSDNQDLQELRPKNEGENVLLKEGDEIIIPEKIEKELKAATGQTNSFVLKKKTPKLSLTLQDERGEAFGEKKYTLEIEGVKKIFEGVTDQDGVLEQNVPLNSQKGILTLIHSEEEEQIASIWDLEIGGLDPISTITGIQQRLQNLSYYRGLIDGLYGPLTQAGIRYLQLMHELKVDGEIGPKTESVLTTPPKPIEPEGEACADEEIAKSVTKIKKEQKVILFILMQQEPDDKSTPLGKRAYEIQHGDGRLEKGETNEKGEVESKTSDSSNYKLRFPDYEAEEWDYVRVTDREKKDKKTTDDFRSIDVLPFSRTFVVKRKVNIVLLFPGAINPFEDDHVKLKGFLKRAHIRNTPHYYWGGKDWAGRLLENVRQGMLKSWGEGLYISGVALKNVWVLRHFYNYLDDLLDFGTPPPTEFAKLLNGLKKKYEDLYIINAPKWIGDHSCYADVASNIVDLLTKEPKEPEFEEPIPNPEERIREGKKDVLLKLSPYNLFKDDLVSLHLIGHSQGGIVLNEFTHKIAELPDRTQTSIKKDLGLSAKKDKAHEWPELWRVKTVAYLSTPFLQKTDSPNLSKPNTKRFHKTCRILNVSNRYDLNQKFLSIFPFPLLMRTLQTIEEKKLGELMGKAFEFDTGLLENVFKKAIDGNTLQLSDKETRDLYVETKKTYEALQQLCRKASHAVKRLSKTRTFLSPSAIKLPNYKDVKKALNFKKKYRKKDTYYIIPKDVRPPLVKELQEFSAILSNAIKKIEERLLRKYSDDPSESSTYELRLDVLFQDFELHLLSYKLTAFFTIEKEEGDEEGKNRKLFSYLEKIIEKNTKGVRGVGTSPTVEGKAIDGKEFFSEDVNIHDQDFFHQHSTPVQQHKFKQLFEKLNTISLQKKEGVLSLFLNIALQSDVFHNFRDRIYAFKKVGDMILTEWEKKGFKNIAEESIVTTNIVETSKRFLAIAKSYDALLQEKEEFDLEVSGVNGEGKKGQVGNLKDFKNNLRKRLREIQDRYYHDPKDKEKEEKKRAKKAWKEIDNKKERKKAKEEWRKKTKAERKKTEEERRKNYKKSHTNIPLSSGRKIPPVPGEQEEIRRVYEKAFRELKGLKDQEERKEGQKNAIDSLGDLYDSFKQIEKLPSFALIKNPKTFQFLLQQDWSNRKTVEDSWRRIADKLGRHLFQEEVELIEKIASLEDIGQLKNRYGGKTKLSDLKVSKDFAEGHPQNLHSNYHNLEQSVKKILQFSFKDLKFEAPVAKGFVMPLYKLGKRLVHNVINFKAFGGEKVEQLKKLAGYEEELANFHFNDSVQQELVELEKEINTPPPPDTYKNLDDLDEYEKKQSKAMKRQMVLFEKELNGLSKTNRFSFMKPHFAKFKKAGKVWKRSFTSDTSVNSSLINKFKIRIVDELVESLLDRQKRGNLIKLINALPSKKESAIVTIPEERVNQILKRLGNLPPFLASFIKSGISSDLEVHFRLTKEDFDFLLRDEKDLPKGLLVTLKQIEGLKDGVAGGLSQISKIHSNPFLWNPFINVVKRNEIPMGSIKYFMLVSHFLSFDDHYCKKKDSYGKSKADLRDESREKSLKMGSTEIIERKELINSPSHKSLGGKKRRAKQRDLRTKQRARRSPSTNYSEINTVFDVLAKQIDSPPKKKS